MTFKAGLQTVAMALALSWTSSAWADVVDEAEEHNEGDSAEDDDSAADDDSAVPSRAELADEIAGFETRLRDLEKRPTGVSTLSTALAGSALVFSIVALRLRHARQTQARRAGTQRGPPRAEPDPTGEARWRSRRAEAGEG